MPSLVRKTYRLLKKFSPSLAALAAGWYSTISGWRFDEIKRTIISHDSSIKNNFISISRSLNIIENSINQERIAFVSPLPPSDTGIASCTYYTFKEANEYIDIYSPFYNDENFLLMSKTIGGNIRILDSSLLLYGDEIINYKKIIIAIGNSKHHFYLHNILKKIKYFNIQDKCVLYVHDPYLNNFLQEGLQISNSEYIELLNSAYKWKSNIPSELGIHTTKWELHDKLTELKITGLQILTEFGFRNFLVNSKAAEMIIQLDCRNIKLSIKRIFHPVFNTYDICNRHVTEIDTNIHKLCNGDMPLIIGTFGIPSYAKCTEIIILAVEELIKRKIPACLIVAGYDANKFFIHNPDLKKEFIIIFDSPSDATLNQIMHKVDIACQLRLKHLGESSGVVPQLLAAGKKTICSPLGSFTEYGDAVSFFRGNTPKELAEMIINTMQKITNTSNEINYCNNKTPKDFRDTLIKYYM